MSYLVNEIITLGIGTPSDIASFILNGLAANTNPPPPSGGKENNALTGSSGDMDGDIEDF